MTSHAPLAPAGPPAGARGVLFATALAEHGDRPALIAPDGSVLTYAALAVRVAEVAERLGAVRRLVLVTAGSTVDAVVAYLAALRGGHPAVLAADPQHRDALIARYDPDVVAGPDGSLDERRVGTSHELHPDLALLLSTSGSTGSAKLVRLSVQNVQANAAAIGTYLDIHRSDRAVLSLPLHYCYGLSVLNSNLARGSAVLLTGRSVIEPEFWEFFRAQRGTSLHGVPYTFELLDRVDFDRMSLPTLRYVTQAGGRLAPAEVRRYARLADRGGWRFVVMYGQAEATARMAYLPPDLAATHPSAVGVPIPGGVLDIRATGDDPHTGELVYRGPNVMLGYAQGPADLVRGRTVDVLATGDLGRRRPDGLFEITGRASRFAKLFGHRIDLDDLERVLREHGHETACTATDAALVVAEATRDAGAVGDLLDAHLPVPRRQIVVRAVAELPRLPNGKIDYPAVSRTAPPTARTASGRSVRRTYASAFPGVRVTGDDTFVGLGGDSLTYVQVSLALEQQLSRVPPTWPVTPVRTLEALQPRHRRLVRVETAILLRATAITLVVGGHVGAFHLLGGAHVLLALAGWSFARFVLAPDGPAAPRILRAAARVAVAAMLWIGFRALVTDEVGWDNVLLVNNYLHRSTAIGYWYVEVLVQILFVLASAAAIPAARRLERLHPFGTAVAVLALALGANLLADDGHGVAERIYSTHGVAWFFVLGWLLYRADTGLRKLAVLAAVLLLVPGYFNDPTRDAVVVVGLVVLTLLPALALPRFAAHLTGLIAGASLFIYLTHYAIFPPLLPLLPAPLVLVVCLAAGTTIWAGGRAVVHGVHAGRRAGSRAATSTTTARRALASSVPTASGNGTGLPSLPQGLLRRRWRRVGVSARRQLR